MSQNEFQDFEVDVDGGLEEVKEWGGEFRLVPAGDWTLDIVHVKRQDSKENKTPMIVVTFEVGDEGEYHGSKLFGNYALTAAAMGRIKQLMIACGASLDKIRASELMGARITATVVHNEGSARTDADGNPLPTKTFANVINERVFEGDEAEAEPEPEPEPPAAKAKPATRTAAPVTPPPVSRATQRNGAARRA